MTKKLFKKDKHRIINSKVISKFNYDLGYGSININEFTYALNLEVMIDCKDSIISVLLPTEKWVVTQDNDNGEKC